MSVGRLPLSGLVQRINGLPTGPSAPSSARTLPGDSPRPLLDEVVALKKELLEERLQRQVANAALRAGLEAVEVQELSDDAAIRRKVDRKLAEEKSRLEEEWRQRNEAFGWSIPGPLPSDLGAVIAAELGIKVEVLRARLEKRLVALEGQLRQVAESEKQRGDQTGESFFPTLQEDLQRSRASASEADGLADASAMVIEIEALQKSLGRLEDSRGQHCQDIEALQQVAHMLEARMEVAQVRLEAFVSERLESFRGALGEEQQQAAAMAEQAKEQALEASRAAAKVAQRVGDVGEGGQLCTLLQTETLLRERLAMETAQWRASLEEERAHNAERLQAMCRALSDEFERSIVSQAVAEARAEACTTLSNEMASWRRESRHAFSADFAEHGERLRALETFAVESSKAAVAAEAAGAPARAEAAGGLLPSSAQVVESRSPVSFGGAGSTGSCADAHELVAQSALGEIVKRLEASVTDLWTSVGERRKEAHATRETVQKEVAEVRASVCKLASIEMPLIHEQAESVKAQLEQFSPDALRRDAQRRSEELWRVQQVCEELRRSSERLAVELRDEVNQLSTSLGEMRRSFSLEKEERAAKQRELLGTIRDRLQGIDGKIDTQLKGVPRAGFDQAAGAFQPLSPRRYAALVPKTPHVPAGVASGASASSTATPRKRGTSAEAPAGSSGPLSWLASTFSRRGAASRQPSTDGQSSSRAQAAVAAVSRIASRSSSPRPSPSAPSRAPDGAKGHLLAAAVQEGGSAGGPMGSGGTVQFLVAQFEGRPAEGQPQRRLSQTSEAFAVLSEGGTLALSEPGSEVLASRSVCSREKVAPPPPSSQTPPTVSQRPQSPLHLTRSLPNAPARSSTSPPVPGPRVVPGTGCGGPGLGYLPLQGINGTSPMVGNLGVPAASASLAVNPAGALSARFGQTLRIEGRPRESFVQPPMASGQAWAGSAVAAGVMISPRPAADHRAPSAGSVASSHQAPRYAPIAGGSPKPPAQLPVGLRLLTAHNAAGSQVPPMPAGVSSSCSQSSQHMWGAPG